MSIVGVRYESEENGYEKKIGWSCKDRENDTHSWL